MHHREHREKEMEATHSHGGKIIRDSEALQQFDTSLPSWATHSLNALDPPIHKNRSHK